MDRYNHHPADAAEAPIVAETWDNDHPQDVPWHSHRRGQIVHVVRGAVSLQCPEGSYILPPHRAIWLPPGTPHQAHYPGPVAFRGLFIEPALTCALPNRVTVFQVDALTRELIGAAALLPWSYPEEGPEARLYAVLLDQLVRLPTAPLCLPEAKDPRIAKVMEGLRADPADGRTISAWARMVHMSERTLARKFQADTGMSFSVWRQELRLKRAIERLAAGDAITTIAIDLGYGSTSSLTTMFKKALGVPPSQFFAVPDEEVGG